MRSEYNLTYSISGGIGGKVNTILAETMQEAIDITFGLYRHIRETGRIVKKTDIQSIIKAKAVDMENPHKIYVYTYKLTKKRIKG